MPLTPAPRRLLSFRHYALAPLAAAILLSVAAASPEANAHAGNTSELRRMSERLRKEPNNAELRLNRVDLYRRMGDLAGAMADLRVVEHHAPALPRLSFERGLTLEALGHDRGAERELTNHIASKKPLAAAWAARARIRERLKNYVGAVADYDQALAKGATPDLALARGNLLEARGKFDEAASGYRAALRHLGGATVVRLALIRAERKLGRYPQALEQVEELLKSAPIKTDYRLLRAEIFEDAKQPARARKDRELALREAQRQLGSRDTALSRLSLAKALHAVGRLDEAKTELKRALALSSRVVEAVELAKAWGVSITPTP